VWEAPVGGLAAEGQAVGVLAAAAVVEELAVGGPVAEAQAVEAVARYPL